MNAQMPEGRPFMKPYYEPGDGLTQTVIPEESYVTVVNRPTLDEVNEIFRKTIGGEWHGDVPEGVTSEAGEPVEGTLQKLLAEFAKLEIERREHDDALAVIAERVKALSPVLLEMMAEAGMQSARVGKLTVFQKSNKWCSKKSDVSTEQVCQALQDAGLGYMVSNGYNANSLKSKMKEYRDAGIEPPESLSSLLNEGETIVLSTRKQ